MEDNRMPSPQGWLRQLEKMVARERLGMHFTMVRDKSPLHNQPSLALPSHQLLGQEQDLVIFTLDRVHPERLKTPGANGGGAVHCFLLG